MRPSPSTWWDRCGRSRRRREPTPQRFSATPWPPGVDADLDGVLPVLFMVNVLVSQIFAEVRVGEAEAHSASTLAVWSTMNNWGKVCTYPARYPGKVPSIVIARFVARPQPILGALVLTLVLSLLGACGVPPPGEEGDPPAEVLDRRHEFGAFLGSNAEGIARIAGFDEWLGTETTVGHTYLPGAGWEDIEGPDFILDPWAQWQREHPDDLFVLNVPMAARNEAGLSDGEVADLLRRGQAGRYDHHFATLGERLVDRGLARTIIVPGWEMNGDTYSHRCGPDPEAWKAYFRNVVTTMRSVAGQDFRFDFTVSRGTDDVDWTECYPGDDVVDIIGMDAYDQAPGRTFDEYVEQPLGLQFHTGFAAERGKPVSFPEWGLFRYGDNPEYIRRMHAWMADQETVYNTLTDYCPHGVYWCNENPRSAPVVKELFGK